MESLTTMVATTSRFLQNTSNSSKDNVDLSEQLKPSTTTRVRRQRTSSSRRGSVGHHQNDIIVENELYQLNTMVSQNSNSEQLIESTSSSTSTNTANIRQRNNSNSDQTNNSQQHEPTSVTSERRLSESEIPEDPELDGLIWNPDDCSATYVGQNAWHIPAKLTVHYASKILKLDLSFNCLQMLTGIEYFNCIQELILDNNQLDDSIRFFYNPFMKTLSLNKNKITDLENLLNEVSLKLPGLTYLSMLGNPACPDQLSSSEHDEKDYRRYRSYVVHRLPQLRFLDSGPVKAQERIDAQTRGHYYRLIRLNSDSIIETNNFQNRTEEDIPDQVSQLTPLPYKESATSTPKGGFGRLRHRYTGKHSEGNRFIRNHEL